MSEVQEILTELGYKLTPDKDGWRTNSMYRSGDNPTALKIYSDGWCQDFVTGERFSLSVLVQRTLNVDENYVKQWMDGKIDTSFAIHQLPIREQIKVQEIFNKELLKDLIPNYNYWIERGISQDTAMLFQGGLCMMPNSILGKLKNRQVLVIYDSKNQVVGFTGRTLANSQIKWKHIGKKANWVWPAYLNKKFIKETNEVILVESPADVLKMWDCNIKNVICLFGTECSYAILNYLIKVNPKTIFISTNNEDSGVGNNAADKIYTRLKRYFNSNQLIIKLPDKKDFCEMDCRAIELWYDKK